MFLPFIENKIELTIIFPPQVLKTIEYTNFSITVNTTFENLSNFLEKFGEEMNQFYDFFGDRIKYIGKGHFVEKADSQCNYDSLDCEIRMTKKCAEWNKVSIHPESKILLSLLLADISIFSYQGTARHILKS